MDTLPRDNRLALHSTQRLLDQARTSSLSTIPHLTEEGVANIWFGVSQYIAKAITEGKGVNVNGLGTFALSVVDDRTPIFQLSEQFIRKHGLKATTKPTSSSCPIVSLNFSDIARATDHNRDDVEACFSEIMTALDGQIREPSPRGLSLIFFGVGKLSIRDGKVRFAFFTKFLENPHTVNTATSSTDLSSRPATVGIVEHLERMSRPGTMERNAATPRLLCTPTVTHLNFGLDGTTPTQEAWTARSSNAALEPCARPQRVHRSKVTWQSALDSAAMVPILDGPDPLDLMPCTPPPDKPRFVKPKPVDVIQEEVDEDELQQYEQLAQRNMQSSLFVPLETSPQSRPTSAQKQATARLPKVHRKDRGNPDKVDPTSVPSYEEWARMREERGKSPSRHRLRIRDQLDRDADIQQERHARDKEEELLLHSLEKKRADKAAALERKREQARRDAERETAMFNASTGKRAGTPKDTTPGGADVFVFRPPTSKTDIRRQNQELLSDLVAQSTWRRTKEEEEQQRTKAAEKDELSALTKALTEAEQRQAQRRQEAMRRYKLDLDYQINFKNTKESEATKVHPRQRVPFDLKHLPGNDKRQERDNSAVGRPAAALGPEMYRRHDQLEQQLAVNARRVYGEQLRADAERRRQVQEEAMQEKEKDTRMVKKILKEYQEDVANEKQFRKQVRQDLQSTWDSQHGDKRQRETEEQKQRRLAADAPIKDQMDYHAYINGFA